MRTSSPSPLGESPWPPGLSRFAIGRCPAHLREDAIQEAWVYHCSGRKPDSAVRAIVRRERRLAACELHETSGRIVETRICEMFAPEAPWPT